MNSTIEPDCRETRRDVANCLAGLGKFPASRREYLRRSLYGSAGLLLANGWAVSSFAAKKSKFAAKAKAKSVIQIWMWGGPTHLDTFDPKPSAGHDYCGPLNKPIATNADGIRIGQLLPNLAKQADKFSILRGMTHGVNGHETASYMVQTGRPGGQRDVYPGAGAVTSLFKGYDAGYQGLVPPYIVLTAPQGRFSEAGFLGNRFKPWATGGDPARTPFEVEGIVAKGISEQRQRQRRQLLGELNSLGRVLKGSASLDALYESEEQAYELILGDAGKLFDLSKESDQVRDRYGRNTFGQSCLMARRLVAKGVPYITINYKGWDTHKMHFQTMNRKLPELDQGMASLLADLSASGLLDSTVIWWSGEFGRTPKILWDPPWNGGRNHFGHAFSAVLAGGGFKGGQVVGKTNDTGEEVAERPIYPADVIGSIYEMTGIDRHAALPHPQGLDVKVMPAEGEVKRGGLLTEIM